MTRTALFFGVSAAVMLAASGGSASAAAADTAAGTPTLGEVVVTAQKVTQDLQRAPLAVSALSGAALDRAAVKSVSDLNATAPGLVVNSSPGNPLTVTIRGAGYEGVRNPSAQPGVSLNQNGVYVTSPFAANANFMDVEQVEVLRGPQGTVFGQNSDGGAINITTTRPRLGMFSAQGDVSVGSYAYDRVRLAANLPVGDDVAIRASFQQQKHDGDTTASAVPGQPGYRLGGENSYDGRLDVLWMPTPKLHVEVWGETYQNNANGAAYKNVLDPNPDPYVVTQDYAARMVQRTDLVSARATYDFSWATLDVITSYQHALLSDPSAQDKLDYPHAIAAYGVHDIAPVNYQETHSTTEEIDLRSPGGGKLDWIVGAFSMQQTLGQYLLEYQSTKHVLDFPTDFTKPDAIFDTGALAFSSRDIQGIVSSSLYAQGTYHFTDRLRLTAGVRGTNAQQVGLVSVFFQPTVKLTTGYSAVTGKVDLEYDLAPRSTVYAMWSSGMKPGGTNLNPGAQVMPTVFKPETVNALEIGSKNQFFDRRLRLNVSAFYNLYDDLQVDSEDPLPYEGGMTNVRHAHIYGVEAEATALLPAGFTLDGGLSTMSGRIDSHQQLFDPELAQQINLANGGPFVGADLAQRLAAFYAPSSDVYGKTPPKVPDFSAHITLSHTLDLGAYGALTSQVRHTYIDPYFFRVFSNRSLDLVPAYRQWDLNFRYEPTGKHYFFEFAVTNLTDTASVTTKYTDNFGVGAVVNQYVFPRQFIGRFGVRF